MFSLLLKELTFIFYSLVLTAWFLAIIVLHYLRLRIYAALYPRETYFERLIQEFQGFGLEEKSSGVWDINRGFFYLRGGSYIDLFLQMK